MTNEVTPPQQEVAPTPMGKVWLIVFATMLVSGSLTWMWHLHAMAREHNKDIRTEEEVRERIRELRAYRDVLRKDGVEGGKIYLFGNVPIQDDPKDSSDETYELM